MKPLDRLLQYWRIFKARPYIPDGSRLLDVGCADGILFRILGKRIVDYVGIDPTLHASIDQENYRLIAGSYPVDLSDLPPFDVITMLAVVEHLTEEQQIETALASFRHLEPSGVLIITTPSPLVDPILQIMKGLRLIDGMALEEHGDLDYQQIPKVFEKLEMILHERFQLGLNHLFVFRKY